MTHLRRAIALIVLLAVLLLASAALRQTARLSEFPSVPLPRAHPALIEEQVGTPKPGAGRIGLLLDEATIPKPSPHSGLLSEEWSSRPKPGVQAITSATLADEVSLPKPRALIADGGGGTASDPTG